MEKRHITDHVKELTPYFEKALDGLVAKYDFMTGRRGMGLMQGIVIDARIPVGSIVTKALEAGAHAITLGRRILRTETAGLAILSVLMFQLENE